MLITFKCTGCGQLISFKATEEEVKKAKIFPVPVVIQHGDHAQVVYLDRALGIREVEVARHAETILDYFVGFINEALLRVNVAEIPAIGIAIGEQIGQFLLTQLHDGKPFMRPDPKATKQEAQKQSKREWKNLLETFTSSLKSVFSGGTVEYSLNENNMELVEFKVLDNPFCRTLINEEKKKSCDLLAKIIAGAVMRMRADDKKFDCVETQCQLVSKKDFCLFTLSKKGKYPISNE